MKQSDIFTIIIIASIGMVGAFFASNAILGNPDELTMKHKNISPISTEVVEPDPETFNRDAINPTVEVYVGQCEDVDQNGILDRAELVACGKASPEESKEEQKTEDKQKKDEGQTGGQTNNNSNSAGGPATENQNSNTGNSNNASSSSSSQNRAGSTE